MKNIISLIILALLSTPLIYGQKVVEKTMKIKDNQELVLDFEFSDKIIISTWNKNEVYVKATVNINDNEHNDHFVLETKTYTNSIKFESDIKNMRKIQKHIIREDDEGRTIEMHTVDMDITFEVIVPKNIEIRSETINGNYEVRGFYGEMDLETISGDVDIALPDNIDADLELSTISGGMYTDFDFKPKVKNGYHHYVKNNYETKLNNGGKDIRLSSISGDIFLRKN